MSVAILDRARAFAEIAQFLPESEREETARAIAARIRRDCTPARAVEHGSVSAPIALVEPEEIPASPEVEFLLAKGVEPGPGLYRMTGQLAKFLSTDAFSHLTREARMQTWWAMRAEEAA